MSFHDKQPCHNCRHPRYQHRWVNKKTGEMVCKSGPCRCAAFEEDEDDE